MELHWPENIVAHKHEISGKWVLHYLTDRQAANCSHAMSAENQVQMLVKVLREVRDEALYWFESVNPALPNQDRQPAGWVRVVDNIDAALKEAGIE